MEEIYVARLVRPRGSSVCHVVSFQCLRSTGRQKSRAPYSEIGVELARGADCGCAAAVIPHPWFVSYKNLRVTSRRSGDRNLECHRAAPPIQVTVQTNAAGLSFTVDGTPYTATQRFSWVPGRATLLPRHRRKAVAQAFNTYGPSGATTGQSRTPSRRPPTRPTWRRSRPNIS
jgi:hypothetical protein